MTETWRTQDGREISVSVMTDSHLINAIRRVRRVLGMRVAMAWAWSAMNYAADAPDGAAMAAEEWANEILKPGRAQDKVLEGQFLAFRQLIDEATRRELQP